MVQTVAASWMQGPSILFVLRILPPESVRMTAKRCESLHRQCGLLPGGDVSDQLEVELRGAEHVLLLTVRSSRTRRCHDTCVCMYNPDMCMSLDVYICICRYLHISLLRYLCNVMSCHVMSCYVLLCYVMLCYVMLCYVMLCYVMLCYVMLCYVLVCYCYVMLCNVMLCYVMLCYVMLCYVMLCNVMFSSVLLHYVMLMLCYVMLCCVMLCLVLLCYKVMLMLC